MTPEQLDEIEKLLNEFWDGNIPFNAKLAVEIADRASPLVNAVREARAALDEREGDMHARIRAGYDKTVADMWRAHCAKIEKDRDEARAEVERLRIENHHLVRAVDWAKDEMNRLREVVRTVHAVTGRDVDWAAFPSVAAASIGNIHEFTKGWWSDDQETQEAHETEVQAFR